MSDTPSNNTHIESLGEAKINTLLLNDSIGTSKEMFKTDDDRVLIDVNVNSILEQLENPESMPSFELAGPREKIYFDPSKLKCAVVNCGGLCPGLNNVIRAIVLELHYRYQVKHIYGIRYGLEGFIPEYGHELVEQALAKDKGVILATPHLGAWEAAGLYCAARFNITWRICPPPTAR